MSVPGPNTNIRNARLFPVVSFNTHQRRRAPVLYTFGISAISSPTLGVRYFANTGAFDKTPRMPGVGFIGYARKGEGKEKVSAQFTIPPSNVHILP